MDYVEVLANWCLRRGVPLPSYKEGGNRVCVSFFNEEYSATPTGPVGMQCAAQEAYEHSGVFGKVVQVGFVPLARRDKEFLVDLAHGAPGCLLAAVREAPMDVQVSAFAPFNYTVEHPTHTDQQPYSYTIYETIHPGEETYWARIHWYLQMRIPTWVRDGTTVYIYSSIKGGNYLRETLETVGVSVVVL